MAGYGVAEFIMSMHTAKEQRALRKREEEFRKTYTAPYLDAQTRLMNAQADLTLDKDLQDVERQVKSAGAMINTAQAKGLLQEVRERRKSLKGDYGEELQKATRMALAGVKQGQQMGDMIDALRLQLQTTQAQHDAAMDQAKLVIDQQGSLLAGFKFATEFGPVLEKKIGQDAFKAGYEAMSKQLGFESKPAAEKRPVSGGKPISAFPGPGLAGARAPKGSMTLDEAVEAFKQGRLDASTLLEAWPSLEGIIDKSLLAPGTTIPSSPNESLNTGSLPSGDFENYLMKQLQR